MIKLFIPIILSVLIVISCTPEIQVRKDDAVRLNLDSVHYLSNDRFPKPGKINPAIEPNSGRKRNPSVLRGTVKTVYLNKQKFIDSSGTERIVESYYYVFIDSLAYSSDDIKYEYIPIGLIDNMGHKIGFPDSTFWVEKYNNPMDPPEIRQLPIEVKEIDECECGDLSISIPPCEGCKPIDISCPFPWEERAKNRNWYFLETKFTYSFYNDFRIRDESGIVEKYPTDAGSGDLTIGYRFGDQSGEHFGLGVLFSTGIPLYAPTTRERIFRPQVMLYGKYQFDELWCMFPFVYGAFGVTVDEASLYLGRVSYNLDVDGWLGLELCDCENEGSIDGRLELAQQAALKSPDIDLSLPISWGLGAGVDIPVHKYFDLSFDLGYRYVSYGDEVRLYGYSIPTRVGTGMFILRGGFAF